MQVHGVRAFDVALDLINQEIIHAKANSKIKKKDIYERCKIYIVGTIIKQLSFKKYESQLSSFSKVIFFFAN